MTPDAAEGPAGSTIPPLVRLPETLLAAGDLDLLGAACDAAGEGRTVLVGPARTAEGRDLDEFVLAAALRGRCAASLGVAAAVGEGRAASLVAREATCAQLLGACDVLLLEGTPGRCHDVATVLRALFAPGVATVATRTEAVSGARNLPLPSVEGGPPVLWRVAGELRALDGDDARCVGTARTAPLGPLHDPSSGSLVALQGAGGPVAPRALLDAVAR